MTSRVEGPSDTSVNVFPGDFCRARPDGRWATHPPVGGFLGGQSFVLPFFCRGDPRARYCLRGNFRTRSADRSRHLRGSLPPQSYDVGRDHLKVHLDPSRNEGGCSFFDVDVQLSRTRQVLGPWLDLLRPRRRPPWDPSTGRSSGTVDHSSHSTPISRLTPDPTDDPPHL